MEDEAHVICCNDSPEFVFVGKEEPARLRMRLLADAYYKQTGGKAHWTQEMKWSSSDTPYGAYRQRCYWHIRTVPLEVFNGKLKA